jgi:hypothetical protein
VTPDQVAALKARVAALTGTLPPDQLALLAGELRAATARLRRAHAASTTEHDSPGELAVSLGQVQKPHLAVLDRLHQRAADGEPLRAAVALPPRHGKTDRLLKVGGLWRLDRDPDCRIMQISGSKSLVEQSSRWVRDELENPERHYRAAPRTDVRAVSDWQLQGHGGGIFVGSIGSRIIGRGANLLQVDDLIGSPQEAESVVYRERAWRFLQSAFGRLEPNGAVMVVNSRWHPDDPIGRLLKEQPGRWEYVAIPALAEEPARSEDDPTRCVCGDLWDSSHGDPLGREPGEPLWPERYDEEALATRRLELGSHYFSAQFQQRARKREGGLWREEWITDRRAPAMTLAEQLDRLTSRTVAVDPSASDDDGGDEAGIVCGGRDKASGDAVVTADLSGIYTPEGWARTALVAAVELDADVVYEKNLTPAFMRGAFKTAWEQLRGEAARASSEGEEPDTVPRVLDTGRVELPRLMPRTEPVRAKVGKELRAGPVAQRYEQRRVVHAGVFPSLEDQQLTWRPTTGDSPDRLDAVVHLIAWLGDTSGTGATVEAPEGVVPTGAGSAANTRYR